MKQRLFCLYLMLCCCFKLPAQASRYAHDQVMDSLVHLFQGNAFNRIYQLCNEQFRSSQSEADLQEFLQKELKDVYGTVQAHRFKGETSAGYQYTWMFKDAELDAQLLLDDRKLIRHLSFLPAEQRRVTKRLQYFSDNPKQSGLDSLIDNTVRAYMQSPQNAALSIGIRVRGKRFFYNYGETLRNSGNFCHKQSMFEMGTLTQSFCGVLLAMAVTEGKLKLDDELARYLPGKYQNLSLYGHPILIKHLASHSSGLPALPHNLREQPNFDSLNPYRGYDRNMLLQSLKTLQLESEPGSSFRYSSMGVALLGIVLEEVYGKTFEDLLQEKICQPHQLSHTAIQIQPAQKALVVKGYDAEGKHSADWDFGIFKAAGAIRTSSEDLLAYASLFLKTNDPSFKLAQTPVFNGRPTAGLAWFIRNTAPEQQLLWQSGAGYASRCFAGIVPELDCAVVVLSNSASDVDYIGIAILNHLQGK